MAKTVSDVLVERLIDWGVDTVFGLPGDGVDGVIEAFRKHRDQIRFIQNRHEEASAFAACAYAKFTGKLGVCVATSGPGAIHLLNGLYDAKMDGAPVLAITGQQYSDLLGSSYQQVVNLLALFEDVSVYNQQVQGTHDVYNLTNTAIRTALSEHGVAHLTIPIDYQVAEFQPAVNKEEGGPPLTPGKTADFPPAFYTEYAHDGNNLAAASLVSSPVPSQAHLQQAADILNSSKKIAVLVGHGAIPAREEIERLAEILGAPVVKSLLGKGAIPDDSPYSTGGLGLLGTRPSEDVMEECETLLMIGTSYPYSAYLPKPGQARGVQIDIDHTRIGLRYPIEVGLVGDARATLQALLPLLRRNEDRSFLRKAQEGVKSWMRAMEEEGMRTETPMKPQVVAWALNKYAAPDAIICGDSGSNTTWIARHFLLKENQMFSCSGNLATMAPGLPYSIGAATAYPSRQVIAFVGDGGFTMLMGEVLTAVKYHLPIKVIIMNNSYLSQIKWEQIALLGNPEYAVQLQPANFAEWAHAAGAYGMRVEDPTKIDDVMQEFLALPGPAILDCVVDANEPPLPAKIKPKQAIHLAEALAKGTPNRTQIALTGFRDKLDQALEESMGTSTGPIGRAMENLGKVLS